MVVLACVVLPSVNVSVLRPLIAVVAYELLLAVLPDAVPSCSSAQMTVALLHCLLCRVLVMAVYALSLPPSVQMTAKILGFLLCWVLAQAVRDMEAVQAEFVAWLVEDQWFHSPVNGYIELQIQQFG